MTNLKDVFADPSKMAEHQRSQQHSGDILNGLSGKRVYFCQRCLNHDILAPRKNHKCECVHAQCNCAKCILVERRRVLNTQLHELEENEQQQQQQRQQQQSQPEEELFQENGSQTFESTESLQARQKSQQREGNSEVLWKNSVLYETLAEQLRTQQQVQQQRDKQLETLQALLLHSSFYINNSIAENTETTTATRDVSPQQITDVEFPSETTANDADGELPLPKPSRENSIASADSLNEELQSFRSRISTVNSVQSNATTNSSLTSGSSSATSPTAFSIDGSGSSSAGLIDGMPLASAENFSSFSYNLTTTRMKGERVPNCQKCGQHGHKSRLKGHKRYCPFKNCSCAKCQVITERQKLMADQIKIRRRQCKDTLMRLKRDKLAEYQRSIDAAKHANALRMHFSAQHFNEKNCNPPMASSYLNTLNMLCKQFTTTPMMTTQDTTPFALTSQLMSTPHINHNSVIQCSSKNSLDEFASRSNSIDEKSKPPFLLTAKEPIKMLQRPPNHILNNLFIPPLQAHAELLRTLAEKSATLGTMNDVNTPVVTTAPTATIIDNYDSPALSTENDLKLINNNNNNTTINDGFYSNLMLWDKARVEAFLKIIQQRQLSSFSDIATAQQQKQQIQLKTQQQQQSMECDVQPQQPTLQQQSDCDRKQMEFDTAQGQKQQSTENSAMKNAQPSALLELLSSFNHEPPQRQIQQLNGKESPARTLSQETLPTSTSAAVELSYTADTKAKPSTCTSLNLLMENQKLNELIMMQKNSVSIPSYHKLMKPEKNAKECGSSITVDVVM